MEMQSPSSRRLWARMPVALVVLALVACALFAGAAPQQAYADSKSQVKSQVLSLLKSYDSNGYYIVSTMNKKGDDILAWWSNSNIFSEIDTMVHEENHGLSYYGAFGGESIYVGGKKSVLVKYTQVFKTKKTAKSVPKKLRTNRYVTYVSKPSAYLSSNIRGPYGLLNEFMAYCWGFNSTVKLYKYANTFEPTADLWLTYYGDTSNVALAHAEFRYFIEHYLVYAKKHNPAVYRGIVGNKNFKKAIKKIDKKFTSIIKTYDASVAKTAKKLRNAGYNLYVKGDMLFMGKGSSASGRGMYVKSYNDFATELAKKKYRSIEKKLGLPKVGKRTISIGSGSSGQSLTAAQM